MYWSLKTQSLYKARLSLSKSKTFFTVTGVFLLLKLRHGNYEYSPHIKGAIFFVQPHYKYQNKYLRIKRYRHKGSPEKARKWKGLVSYGKMGFLNSGDYQIQTQVQWVCIYFVLLVHTYLLPFLVEPWLDSAHFSSILSQILTKDKHTTKGRLIRANKIWLGLLFKASQNCPSQRGGLSLVEASANLDFSVLKEPYYCLSHWAFCSIICIQTFNW